MNVFPVHQYGSARWTSDTALEHSSGTQLRNTVQERISGGRSRLRFRTSNWHGIRSVFQVSVPARVSITRFKPVLDAFCAPRAEALRTSKEQICGNTTRKLLTVLLGCGFCGLDKKKNCRCAIHLDKAQHS